MLILQLFQVMGFFIAGIHVNIHSHVHRKRFRKNVLSYTKSQYHDVLFWKNVLDGTKCPTTKRYTNLYYPGEERGGEDGNNSADDYR